MGAVEGSAGKGGVALHGLGGRKRAGNGRETRRQHRELTVLA
ncbi:MAG: hypothetical protein JWO93_938 [Micrococcaceae bacterium]|jgi:hypothetical protein|nr:hypothetical protein [Micrococcaceae bacterium]